MAERRDFGEQLGLDVLTRDEQLHGLDPRGARSVDEVLALGRKQSELVAPPALLQLANELELLVLARADQDSADNADFAFSAIDPNACGSLTARSASTFRSSSISAFFSPAMNWLYESPLARAPALIRMIQRRRNVRFLFLRSR